MNVVIYARTLSGGCSGDYTSSDGNHYTVVKKYQCEIDQPYQAEYTYKDFCCPTKCPECGEEVYFIRHNGGVVWVDELGWPWPKHPCMDDSSGWKDLNIIGRADLENKTYGLCIRIKIIENEEAEFSTYLAILYSDRKEKTLLVEGKANRLLGRVVSIGSRKNSLAVYSPESITYTVVNNNVLDDIFELRNEVLIHCPICKENIKKSNLFIYFDECQINKCPKHNYKK
jgi:hypothetical protein